MCITDDIIDNIIANSYKNFHVKGLDYICLERTPTLTRKVYFLDGNAAAIPEVVNPHNHRYAFTTTVLAGKFADHLWCPLIKEGPETEMFHRFDYMTPLNGGNGFTYVRDQPMVKVDLDVRQAGEKLRRNGTEVHTIQMLSDQTVLYLEQGPDEIPLDVATQCWTRKGAPVPDTTGLYERFTFDEVLARLRTIEALIDPLLKRIKE